MRCFFGRQWKQFSLCAFFLFLSLLCVFFGWWSNLGRKQRDAVAAIRRLGGDVAYRGEAWYDFRRKDWKPTWLKNLLGRDHFDPVTVVSLSSEDFRDTDLAYLEALPDVEEIWIGEPITDAALDHLRGMIKLEELNLHGSGFTDAGLQKLRGLSELRSLTSRNARFSDEGLRELTRHRNLETLHLYSDNQRSPITDAGVRHLHKLKKLTWLILDADKISKGAEEDLQRALPQCEIWIQRPVDYE